MTNDLEIPANFKTSLPPRKRAKTQEEKEQRRIERILRNRKAAHASREKKRKHVEFLENYVSDVEHQLELFKALSDNLLKNYYSNDSKDINKLLKKIDSLPDLSERKQMNFDFSSSNTAAKNSKANSEDVDDEDLPKTPESFISSLSPNNNSSISSPNSNSNNNTAANNNNSQAINHGESVKTEFNQSSSVLDNDLNFYDLSPLSSPETDPVESNKFSLNLIPQIKLENELTNSNIIPQQIKLENSNNTNFIPTPINEDNNNSFSDFQIDSIDNSFVFEELRNPAAITKISNFILGSKAFLSSCLA